MTQGDQSQTHAPHPALAMAIDLRMEVMAKLSAFQGTEADRQEVKEISEKALLRERRDEDQRCKATPGAEALVLRDRTVYVDFLGCEIDHVRIDYRLGSDAARDEVLATLREWAPSFTKKTVFNLESGYAELLPEIYKLGMFLDSTIFIGDPTRSLAPIADYPADDLFRKAGCTTRKMATADDVTGMAQLKQGIFRQNPELCWFYLNEGHQEFEHKQLTSLLEQPDDIHRHLIFKNNQPVGMYGFDVSDAPFWGKIAGMDFAYLPAIRGLGLGKAGYKRLFEEMIAHGVNHYIGGTSNPAVLKMAKTFGREVLQYHLRFAQ